MNIVILKSFEKYIKNQLNEQIDHEEKLEQAEEKEQILLNDDTILTFSEIFLGAKVYTDADGNRFIIGTKEEMINYATEDFIATVDQIGGELIPWSFIISHYMGLKGSAAKKLASLLKTTDGDYSLELIEDLAGSVHQFMVDYINDQNGFFDIRGMINAKSSDKHVKEDNNLVVLEIEEA